VCCHFTGVKNEYIDKFREVVEDIDNWNVSKKFIMYIKSIYTLCKLSHNKYSESYPYIHAWDKSIGPGVNAFNRGFFKEDDVGKTLLIYDGGGLGDKMMFARLIIDVARKYKDNKVIVIYPDRMVWLYRDVYKKNNIELLSYTERDSCKLEFDYHTSAIDLIKWLKYEYTDITFSPLFIDLEVNISERVREILEKIKKDTRKKYILNWKGAKITDRYMKEKKQRNIKVTYLEKLLEIKSIRWVIVTKVLTDEEKTFLEKHDIEYYGEEIDNGENRFNDTVELMRNVDGVISTDTSLVHLSSNLGLKTYVMLTIGNEWRWKCNNWYPDIIKIVQDKYGEWGKVIESVKDKITISL
jgi:hypothetical protein